MHVVNFFGDLPQYTDNKIKNWGSCEIPSKTFNFLGKGVIWLKDHHSTIYSIINYRFSMAQTLLLNLYAVGCFSLVFTATPWALLGVAILPISFVLYFLHRHIDTKMLEEAKKQSIEDTQLKIIRILESNGRSFNKLPFVPCKENFRFKLKTLKPITKGVIEIPGKGSKPFLSLKLCEKNNPSTPFVVILKQNNVGHPEWLGHKQHQISNTPPLNILDTQATLKFLNEILTDKHSHYKLCQ